MQEEGFSPVKSGPAYVPVLHNALPARGPSPLGGPAPPGGLTPAARPVGDLFRPPGGSLPNVAVPNCPVLPDWNQQRPYLTGQFLMESLDLEDTSGSQPQAVESFSPAVQEVVGMLNSAVCVLMRYATLCCAVLCCAVLYCAVLCCACSNRLNLKFVRLKC